MHPQSGRKGVKSGAKNGIHNMWQFTETVKIYQQIDGEKCFYSNM